MAILNGMAKATPIFSRRQDHVLLALHGSNSLGHACADPRVRTWHAPARNWYVVPVPQMVGQKSGSRKRGTVLRADHAQVAAKRRSGPAEFVGRTPCIQSVRRGHTGRPQPAAKPSVCRTGPVHSVCGTPPTFFRAYVLARQERYRIGPATGSWLAR